MLWSFISSLIFCPNFEKRLVTYGLTENPECMKNPKKWSNVLKLLISHQRSQVSTKIRFQSWIIVTFSTGPGNFVISLENWPFHFTCKTKAFSVFSREYWWYPCVLRWILRPNRPNGPFCWRFDFVETPPSISKKNFSAKMCILRYAFHSLSVNATLYKWYFFPKRFSWPLEPMKTTFWAK